MERKNVKIIGLSINQNFGSLKAVNLKFNSKNRLTIIKGEVGSGKTTLNRAIRLTTQGSGVLEDKALYGDIDVITQLSDGESSIFVGCKTNKAGALIYFLYTIDKNGKKVKDLVVDGQKLTPANYLKSLQTALTWRLDELTSENATTQRNILLELYRSELEAKGVIFDKNNPAYVDSIIDKIEKAKSHRSLMDMQRKEVGGIADDMTKKGIPFAERRPLKKEEATKKKIAEIAAEITLATTNLKQTRENKLNKLKIEHGEINTKLRLKSDKIIKGNKSIHNELDKWKNATLDRESNLKSLDDLLDLLGVWSENKPIINECIKLHLPTILRPDGKLENDLVFNSEGKCISFFIDFQNNKKVHKLLKELNKVNTKWTNLNDSPLEEVDNTKLEKQKADKEIALKDIQDYNKDTAAINAFHNWRDSNDLVIEIKKDYYLKLTGINTGVKGLHICPEYVTDEKGEKVAKDNNIYLMYNGSYDKKYFNNPNKELRKLSSYSGTQRPMICLLIQNYLLSKKNKVLPYLWIDNIPIDNKTKDLLEKMSKELDLWLFVNWTGDFTTKTLKDGEILLENGEVLIK